MYISSIQQTNENSIEFFLSTWTRRVIKSPQAKSLQGQVLDTILELSTAPPPIALNWLSSPLKSRAQLYYSGPELCNSGTKKDKRVRDGRAL